MICKGFISAGPSPGFFLLGSEGNTVYSLPEGPRNFLDEADGYLSLGDRAMWGVMLTVCAKALKYLVVWPVQGTSDTSGTQETTGEWWEVK